VAGQDTRRRRWDRRAERYGTSDVPIERWLTGDGRVWVCSRARGRTLEVAIGTGRNLPLYGEDVELTGVDLSAGMLAVSRRLATEIGREVDLREGAAERLPFPSETFDTVVCTFALCEVPDRSAALAEMRRVLRPGGVLLLLDHAQWRWLWSPRPAELAVRQGFVPDERKRTRLGSIDRFAAHRP